MKSPQEQSKHLIVKLLSKTLQSTFLSPTTFQGCPLLWVGLSGEMCCHQTAPSSLFVLQYLRWITCRGAAALDTLLEKEFTQMVSGSPGTGGGNTPRGGGKHCLLAVVLQLEVKRLYI